MHSVTTMPDAAGATRPTGITWLPGGEFTMRPDAFYQEERPVRLVAVDGFWMDTRPVTVADIRRFVTADGYLAVAEPPLRGGDCPDAAVGRRDRHPDTHVAQPDGQACAAWAATSLPTEPEREFATWTTDFFRRWHGAWVLQGEAVDTSAGHIGFRCVIQSGPLLARPGLAPGSARQGNRRS